MRKKWLNNSKCTVQCTLTINNEETNRTEHCILYTSAQIANSSQNNNDDMFTWYL